MRPFWKWRHWKSIGFYPYTRIMELKFGVDIQSRIVAKSPDIKKNQYGRQTIICFKWRRWKSISLYPYTQVFVLLKFGVDIENQNKVRVWKSKYSIWLPPSCFESDVTENH